jgi:hypothetical protein
MSALRKIRMPEATERVEAGKTWRPVVITGHGASSGEVAAKAVSRVKSIALFLAAPFIGLAYIVAMPVVGICMLAWLAGKTVAKHAGGPVKAVCALAGGSLLGLVYVLAWPVIGLGMLCWFGGKALIRTA